MSKSPPMANIRVEKTYLSPAQKMVSGFKGDFLLMTNDPAFTKLHLNKPPDFWESVVRTDETNADISGRGEQWTPANLN